MTETGHSEEDMYLGVNGVAKRLMCSPSAVRLWEEQGRIPPAGRVSGTGRRVWRLMDIDAFANGPSARRRGRREKAAA